MRNLKDRKGVVVRPERVSGDDAFAGLLEGSPYMARKLRLMQAQEQMKRPGNYVHAMDVLERDAATATRDSHIWPPVERWTAFLIGPTDYRGRKRKVLRVNWYQEGCDPMGQLDDIVAGIDFMQLCVDEPYDPD